MTNADACMLAQAMFRMLEEHSGAADLGPLVEALGGLQRVQEARERLDALMWEAETLDGLGCERRAPWPTELHAVADREREPLRV